MTVLPTLQNMKNFWFHVKIKFLQVKSVILRKGASLVSFLPFQLTISRQADHRDRFLQQPRFLPRRGPLNFRSIGCDIFSSVSWKKSIQKIKKSAKTNLFYIFSLQYIFQTEALALQDLLLLAGLSSSVFIICEAKKLIQRYYNFSGGRGGVLAQFRSVSPTSNGVFRSKKHSGHIVWSCWFCLQSAAF